MQEIADATALPVNQLLNALTAEQLRRLTKRGELVEMRFGTVLYEKNQLVADVYFPVSGVISLFAVEDRAMLEVAMTGSEGVLGASVLAGVTLSPHLAIVQGTGAALKVSAADFLREFERNKLFARALNRYSHFLNVQISQSVLCNSLHVVEARLACQLLLMQDRLKIDEFPLKQEFLANILGVRREAVTRAAVNLQQREIIAYSRGKLQILDRAKLEAVCCRCYEAVSGEYQKLLAVNQ